MVLPLQAGLPGGTEILFLLVMMVLFSIVPLIVAAYIYRDAKGRDSSHALAWAAAAFVGNWIVWALYFVVRDEVGPDGPSVSGGA